MADVFIPYRNTPERRSLVKRLATVLRAHGAQVWWDYGLEAGQGFRQQIVDELANAKVVIALWCSESVQSRWVLMEAELAKDKLVPARLQDVAPPPEFANIQAADLIGWDGNVSEPRLSAFVSTICRRLDKPPVLPADTMEEFSAFSRLTPLPRSGSALQKASTSNGDILSDLRVTWNNFPGRGNVSSVMNFLTKVKISAPGSGLEFEVEERL